ncbi:MAG: hypothetical protein V1778_03140, partial [bacterium]
GIVLSILGGILAIYHVILQLGAPAIVPCSTRVFAISCGTTIFRFYGYVTIPVMSLTAFVMILLLLILGRKAENHSETMY